MTNAELGSLKFPSAGPWIKQQLRALPGYQPLPSQWMLSFETLSLVSLEGSRTLGIDILEMMKDGARVDHVTSAFATQMYQLDNAIKTTSSPGRHWYHALPEVMKDSELELGDEARAIEASFTR
jgi:hypothetical protein